MRTAALLLVGLILSCGDEETVQYERFNADGDTITLSVGAEDVLDAIEIDLHSTTGEVVIGTAKASPGGGPIGTEHTFVVAIDDDWQDQVDRVSVRIDSGERGEDEYDLEQDSADEGLYKLSLVSVGDEGEARDDVVEVHVWDVIDDNDQASGSADDTGA